MKKKSFFSKNKQKNLSGGGGGGGGGGGDESRLYIVKRPFQKKWPALNSHFSTQHTTEKTPKTHQKSPNTLLNGVFLIFIYNKLTVNPL